MWGGCSAEVAHLVGRRTALKVAKVKKPGTYADGAGLYLQLTGYGEIKVAKSWIYRFTSRSEAPRSFRPARRADRPYTRITQAFSQAKAC
jgi:hypothetical protein